jgi:hypothetical protein
VKGAVCLPKEIFRKEYLGDRRERGRLHQDGPQDRALRFTVVRYAAIERRNVAHATPLNAEAPRQIVGQSSSPVTWRSRQLSGLSVSLAANRSPRGADRHGLVQDE